MEEVTTQDCEYQEMGIIGAILEAVSHNTSNLTALRTHLPLVFDTMYVQ